MGITRSTGSLPSGSFTGRVMVLNITSIIIASIRFDARAEGSVPGGAGERATCVRGRTELVGASAYRPGWPSSGRLDVHDKVRAVNTAFLNLVEPSMNSKAVVSAILAMSLATGGLAFAD